MDDSRLCFGLESADLWHSTALVAGVRLTGAVKSRRKVDEGRPLHRRKLILLIESSSAIVSHNHGVPRYNHVRYEEPLATYQPADGVDEPNQSFSVN